MIYDNEREMTRLCFFFKLTKHNFIIQKLMPLHWQMLVQYVIISMKPFHKVFRCLHQFVMGTTTCTLTGFSTVWFYRSQKERNPKELLSDAFRFTEEQGYRYSCLWLVHVMPSTLWTWTVAHILKHFAQVYGYNEVKAKG